MNVIPESVTISGTMRSFTLETRKLLQAEIRRAAQIVDALGGEAEVKIVEWYPPTVNDAAATAAVFNATKKLLGDEKVTETKPRMAGEDFSYMLQQVPGCFMSLGVKGADWDRTHMVHTPTFRVDESALPIGTAAMVASAVEWMQKKG